MLQLEQFLERLVHGDVDQTAALDYFAGCTDAQKAVIAERLEAALNPPAAPTLAAPTRRLAARTNHTCTDAQRRYLQDFVDGYAARTAQSKALAARHRPVLADQRTPSHYNALLKEIQYPLTLTHAAGACVHDVDGNRYIDIGGDFGVNLFGHAPAFLNEALKAQLDCGLSLSGRYGPLAEAAELFCELTGHQRVVFCQSGTEALISALRLARAFTERQKVVLFNYAYHGHADVFLNEFTPGVSEASLSDAVGLEYGSEASLTAIEAAADELACVIVEPVQSERLELQPVEFLRRLREITARKGVVLIFDEMITGFRAGPRGCQGAFGVEADLATYGKILGGGLPAGAVGGRADIMDWVDGGDWRYGDASKPKTATYIAGTHTQNPLKMAATLAVLRELKRVSPGLQSQLSAWTQRLADEVNVFAAARRLPFDIVCFASQFRLRFHTPQFTLTQALFLHLLNGLGVRHHMHGNCFLTAAHTESDVAEISAALQAALQTLLDHGFFYEAAEEIEAGEAPRPRGRGGAPPPSAAADSAAPAPAKAPAPVAARHVDVEDLARGVRLVIGAFLELPPEEIAGDEELGDLGLDSILFVKILKILSAELGCKLSIKAFADVRTVTGLVERIRLELIAPSADTGDDEAGAAEPTAEPSAAVHTLPAAPAFAPTPAAAPPPAAASQAAGGDVAIVGMSGVFPGAPDIDAFWRTLSDGRVAVSEVPPERWDWRDIYSTEPAPGRSPSKWGGFINACDQFDPLFFRISPREAKYMDPQERLLLMQAYRALEDASLNPARIAGGRVGVFVGYEFTDYGRRIEALRAQLPPTEGDLFDLAQRPYSLANRVSFTFDFKGPSEAVNVNCASSAVALNRACQSLRAGESDVALVGGVALNLLPEGFLQAGELLSPTGACRVFGEQANGYVKGEACVVHVLKRLDDALRDGDAIYAVVKGCAINNRGRGASLSEVRSEPLQEVIAECHRRAGVLPQSVRYIEVDGYSTRTGDWLEFEAIKAALGPADARGKTCALGSLKPNLGNLEPAGAAAGVAKVALALSQRRFPPTVGVSEVSSLLDVGSDSHPLYLALDPIPFTDMGAEPVRAGVNAFADSGVNVHILLEEAPQRMSAPPAGPNVFALSSRSAATLDASVAEWIAWLQRHPDADLGRLCYSLQVGREAFSHRLACVAATVPDLVDALRAVEAGRDCPRVSRAVAERRDPAADPAPRPAPATDPLLDLARRWTAGEPVDWLTLYPQGRPIPLHQLPTYAFARKRCWVDVVAPAQAPDAPAVASVPAIATAPVRVAPVDAGPVDAAPPAPEAPPPVRAAGGGLAAAMVRIREIVEGFLELSAEDEIDEFASFADMGLTSLAIVEFVDEINRRFGLELPETTAFDYPSLRELAQHIAALGSAGAPDTSRVASPAREPEPA